MSVVVLIDFNNLDSRQLLRSDWMECVNTGVCAVLLCYVRTVATHNQPPPLTLTLDNIITSNSHGKNIRFLKHFLAKIFLNFHLSWKIFCEKVKMLMLCVNDIQLMVAYTRGHGPARL